ncbi:DUF4185 domain-containing protein, partial [Patescibacteria group bacterium]|nr:DUF4185 domain-containing protein [Patescibacteria group bacterium]MBU4072638.1 DUF4185 domain-containing protein [Patescibacteria group bacterium]MBU4125177.1 DUF4185 domain-containing protein [Patescibacteria group bacterium]
WCGDGAVQAAYGEQCEAPGKGTSASDQWDCVGCKWTGGWCGDGTIQDAYKEQCDGTNLNSQSCGSLDYTKGSLACGAKCILDSSACGCAAKAYVTQNASGSYSCYLSSDSRWISKLDGAQVTFEYESNNSCVKVVENCYESRTCKCSNGDCRCTESGSCSAGSTGCKDGYCTLKYHCPSGDYTSDQLDNFAGASASGGGTISASGGGTSSAIKSIAWNCGSLKQDAKGSDNWPMTWSNDDNQYTAWGDGWGFKESGDKKSLGVSKVSGSSAASFTGSERDTWAENGADGGVGKSYGILSVAGTLYMWVGYGGDGSGPRAWRNSKVYKSTDYGKSWSKANWSFTDDDMANPTFLQFGKDYASNQDGYVYIYAPDIAGFNLDIGDGYGDYPSLTQQGSGKIILMRVPKNKIMARSSYEFFKGLDAGNVPSWTSNLSQRTPVLTSSNGVGWTMSAIYYPEINRYILMTEHTASHAGNFKVYDAPNPWGPWTVVEEHSGSWCGFSTTFYWNISPKWISGNNFTLVFTGSQSYDYWNTVTGTIVTY